MHYFSNLFDKVLYRSPVHHQEFHPDNASRDPTELAWQLPIACIQCWDTPDDGQGTWPKHV